MVEQDLVICRALVDIFNHLAVKDNLAFRGGTALFKLHMPAARYSEDIDLVQVQAGAIGPLMVGIREALTPWLGESLFTEAEELAELHANVRDAVVCHFDPDRMPKMIRLQILPTRFGGIDTLPRLA
jgi:hypothetical protein